jgi:hypothetical protein
LREDILQQDYRVLYLAWLKAVPYEGFADYVYEPPVPPGLGQLSPSLRDFVELFEVDEHLVQVAAKASGNQQTLSSEQLQQAIPKLSREECNDFLARLVEGEANLSIKLNRRLRELAGTPQPVGEPQRTVGQLFAAAEEEREREERRKAEEARAERIKELEALAQREARAWQEVEALIQKSQPKGYDQAVQLLGKLQELAVYQGRVAAFQARLNQIYQQYSRRSSLIARLSKADLRQR